MFVSCRLSGFLLVLLVWCLGWCPASFAADWSLNVAPLALPDGAAGAFSPSSSVPVTPQFFRLAIRGKQVIIAAEAPYVEPLKPVPTIRVQEQSPYTSPPVAETDLRDTTPALRGPEAWLLRRPPTVVSQTHP